MKKLTIFTFIIFASLLSQKEEKLESCPSLGRSISSVEEKTELVCAQQEKIAGLQEELEAIEKEKERVVSVLEKVEQRFQEYEEEAQKKEEEKEKRSTQRPMANFTQFPMINNQFAMQYHKPAPITYAYSPFHNSSTSDNMEYLKLVTAQRLQFSLSEGDYWHPEWDMNGNMTNPIYGFGDTWNYLEGIHRTPTSHQYPTRTY